MYMYEPPCDDWFDRDKPNLINNTIQNICQDILKRGDRSCYQDIFDYMYLYIEENIQKFMPEENDCHDYN